MQKSNIDGFLNIDKPAGWTSHDVVAKVRGLLKVKKAGHLGTLDPIATGVLPLCIGKATKLVEYLEDADKEYRVVMKLGTTTDTQDITGKVIETSDKVFDLAAGDVEKALTDFVGRITQIPPMYSAIKVKGIPLYRLAREGKIIPRKPREVTIYDIKVLSIELPYVTFDVTCSKGTYIRTLCADTGEHLGVGAHQHSLQRRRVGMFTLEEAITLKDLQRLISVCPPGREEDSLGKVLYPLEYALSSYPAMTIKKGFDTKVLNGAPIQIGWVEGLPQDFKKRGILMVCNSDRHLIAIASSFFNIEDLPSIAEDGVAFKVEKVVVQT